MYDSFLDSAHIPECCSFEEQSLDTVAVQLNGLGTQVQGPRVAFAIEAMASREKNKLFEKSLNANLGVQIPLTLALKKQTDCL